MKPLDDRALLPASVTTQRPPPSIRRRLTRSVLWGSLACGLAVLLATWLAAHQEVDELLDDTLRASADVLGALLPSKTPLSVVQTAALDGRFAWQVVDASQHVVMRSARAPQQPLSPLPVAGFVDTPRWRVFGAALGADGRMLYVAQTRAERDEAQFEVALGAMLAALGIALLGLFWLRAQLRYELAPLQRLSERLATHEPLAQGATLGAAERAEFQSVHQAIDGLGRRLAHRLAHERAFTAHAAHALRTPLAGIDAQLALCLRESPAALQPRLLRVREAASRLQRVVAALLALFRSDGELVREAVDLPALCAQFALERLHIDVQATRRIDADSGLLAAALVNLLDNAAHHGASRVRVSTPAAGTLRLDDDGPGVGPERRHALSVALAAQDYDSVPGLGLTLADLVARAHGGQLSLPEPAGAQGFAVELSLRAA